MLSQLKQLGCLLRSWISMPRLQLCIYPSRIIGMKRISRPFSLTACADTRQSILNHLRQLPILPLFCSTVLLLFYWHNCTYTFNSIGDWLTLLTIPFQSTNAGEDFYGQPYNYLLREETAIITFILESSSRHTLWLCQKASQSNTVAILIQDSEMLLSWLLPLPATETMTSV